jgi:small subunit ribosomal protein S4
LSIAAAMDPAQRGAPITWIAADRHTYSGRVLQRPGRHDIPIAAPEQLIFALYSN